jgi:hypothetical protein
MSGRSELAQRLADIVNKYKMNNPFGGEVGHAPDKKYYDFAFSYPAVLDGYVRIYSEKFILIEARGKLAPSYDFKQVYDSEANAAQVLTLIAEAKPDEALDVPIRIRKEAS